MKKLLLKLVTGGIRLQLVIKMRLQYAIWPRWPDGMLPAGNNIQKFSYASGGDPTDVGDLSVARGNRKGEGAFGFQS